MNPTFLAYFHIEIPMLCFVDRLKNGAVMHLKFKKANCRMICLCPINCSSSKSEKKKSYSVCVYRFLNTFTGDFQGESVSSQRPKTCCWVNWTLNLLGV